MALLLAEINITYEAEGYFCLKERQVYRQECSKRIFYYLEQGMYSSEVECKCRIEGVCKGCLNIRLREQQFMQQDWYSQVYLLRRQH